MLEAQYGYFPWARFLVFSSAFFTSSFSLSGPSVLISSLDVLLLPVSLFLAPVLFDDAVVFMITGINDTYIE